MPFGSSTNESCPEAKALSDKSTARSSVSETSAADPMVSKLDPFINVNIPLLLEFHIGTILWIDDSGR
jgi:hypothetical protein